MDDVTIEWFGCATFRVRIGGTTLFFDTYLDKAPGVPSAGLRAAEVREADFAFISHAHFDHVLGADVIAKATGATVVGNYEVAHLMAANSVPDEQVLAVSGGETVDCGDGIHVRVLPALHSCLFAAAPGESGSACLGDLGISARAPGTSRSGTVRSAPDAVRRSACLLRCNARSVIPPGRRTARLPPGNATRVTARERQPGILARHLRRPSARRRDPGRRWTPEPRW